MLIINNPTGVVLSRRELEEQGAFYVFPNISSLGLSSADMAAYLLDEFRVATAPMSGFGRAGEGFIRISYAASIDMIGDGLERLHRAFVELRKKAA